MGTREGTPCGGEGMGHPGPVPARKAHAANEVIYRFIFCKKINYHHPPPLRSQVDPKDGEMPSTEQRAGRGALAPPQPRKGFGARQERCQPLGLPSGSRRLPPPLAMEPREGVQGGRGWGQCWAASRTSRSSRGVHGRA